MEYRFLGRTGLKVSEVAMGTQTFGWVADEKEAHQILDLFIETGGNFIDTANIYNDGVTETILGNWIKQQNYAQGQDPVTDVLILFHDLSRFIGLDSGGGWKTEQIVTT